MSKKIHTICYKCREPMKLSRFKLCKRCFDRMSKRSRRFKGRIKARLERSKSFANIEKGKTPFAHGVIKGTSRVYARAGARCALKSEAVNNIIKKLGA